MNQDIRDFVNELKATAEELDQAQCLCRFQAHKLAQMILRAATLIEFIDGEGK